jgi:CubicO group peptidase (beta-lactamase class C family)
VGAGERQAYHAISLGFYEGEPVRRTDPAHRSLGRFFHEEIATPLGFEFYLGLPDAIPDERLAPLEPPSLWKRLTGTPPRLTLAAMNPRSVLSDLAVEVGPPAECGWRMWQTAARCRAWFSRWLPRWESRCTSWPPEERSTGAVPL